MSQCEKFSVRVILVIEGSLCGLFESLRYYFAFTCENTNFVATNIFPKHLENSPLSTTSQCNST